LDQITLFMNEFIYIVYTFTNLHNLYMDQFTPFTCGPVYTACGVVYTVYIRTCLICYFWTKLKYLYADQFKLFMFGQNFNVKQFTIFIYEII